MTKRILDRAEAYGYFVEFSMEACQTPKYPQNVKFIIKQGPIREPMALSDRIEAEESLEKIFFSDYLEASCHFLEYKKVLEGVAMGRKIEEKMR